MSLHSEEDLIFRTDTDSSQYPIYVTASDIWLRAKPYRKIEEFGATKKIYDVPILSTFFVKSVEEEQGGLTHELLETAVNTLKEITGKDPHIEKFRINYEVYEGDMERLLGEASAYAIRLISIETPLSGKPGRGRAAWAIGYDWKKRICAKANIKANILEKYTYVKGEEGRCGKAHVRVIIKLPIPTEEFTKLFNAMLKSSITTTEITITTEIEGQIKQLQEAIAQKENELQALKEQLSRLQLKLQLEQMKRQVV